MGSHPDVDLDLSKGTVTVPDYKIEVLRSILAATLDKDYIPAKHIASIVGKIISMSIVLGPVARLMMRSLYTLLNNQKFWFQRLTISTEARTELSFWSKTYRTYGRVIQPLKWSSGSGFGGYTMERGPQIVHGQWSEWEAQQRSTWRELKAVHTLLQALAPKL